MKFVQWMVFVVAVLVSLTFVSAQEDKVAAPTLTDVQKLRLQNAVLRVQLAQSELDRVREQANAFIHSLQVSGYELDFERLEYVAKKPPSPSGNEDATKR